VNIRRVSESTFSTVGMEAVVGGESLDGADCQRRLMARIASGE